jgi:hypothetical protein
MTIDEKALLERLLNQLKEERLKEYRDDGYDVDGMDESEIEELDDGDCLIQGINIVLGAKW